MEFFLMFYDRKWCVTWKTGWFDCQQKTLLAFEAALHIFIAFFFNFFFNLFKFI